MWTFLLICVLVLPGNGQATYRCVQEIQDIRDQMEAEIKDLKVEMVAQADNMKVMLRQMEAKVETSAVKVKMDMEAMTGSGLSRAIGKAVRDLPYVMVCAFRRSGQQLEEGDTITYDKIISEFNNAERPGGGDGELDIATGTYYVLTNGYYTISYSGQAYTDDIKVLAIEIHVNGVSLGGVGSWVTREGGLDIDQGTVSLVSNRMKPMLRSPSTPILHRFSICTLGTLSA